MIELAGVAVDGDDRPRAREAGSGDHLEPDAAAADHAAGRTDSHAGAVDGADPGDHAAAEQRRLPQRQRRRERHDPARRHDRILREAGDHQPVLEHLAAGAVKSRGTVHQEALEPVAARRLAQRPAARAARAAGAAGRDEAERDVVAGRDATGAVADRLDHPRALVAEDHRPAPVAEASVR